MGRGKWFLVHAGVFFGVLGCLWILLMSAAAIPNERLREHMETSALSYKDKKAFSFERGKKWNGISDNYADAILLNVSWNMGRGHPFLAALDTWYYSGEGLGENAGLYLAVTEDAPPDTNYTRYWHGTAMIVRLFHLCTDVEGIKAAGLGAILALAFLTLAMLVRRNHGGLALALLLSMGAVQIWNTGLSMEYETAFVICFLLSPLYLWLERKGDGYLTCLSVAGGVLIAFFDFLTTETVVILVPLILVEAVRAREKRLQDGRKERKKLFQCGLCWVLAYGGTFLVKWTAASLAVGENQFLLALTFAGERAGGLLPGGDAGLFLRIFMAAAANLTVMFGGESRVELMRVAAGLGASALLTGSILCLFYKNQGNQAGIRLIALLGSAVFVRYMILSNHSYLHEFFTYRGLISPALAVFVSLALSVELPGGRGKRSAEGTTGKERR